MTDQPQLEVLEKPLPPPPDTIELDDDILQVAQERWTECPLKACKRDKELLYSDFFLRDVRTNRVMCSACAVRTEVGYIAQEVVKQTDDKFFQGTQQDYLVVGILCAIGSAIINLIAFVIPLFFFLWFFIGAAAGSFIGYRVRKMTGGRIGRQSGLIAVASIIAGFFIGGLVYLSTNGILGAVAFSQAIEFLFYNWSALLATGAMAFTVYGIFQRRI